MEFGVLGPLLVRGAADPITLSSAKQRALLSVLLLGSRDDVVRAERLIDELWGEDPPATAGKALQVHVSQLRRTLGREDLVITRPSGYAIAIEPEALDLHRFEALLDEARSLRAAGDSTGALAALRRGLALWRGPALADVTLLGPGAAEAERLNGLRIAASEDRLELELAQGDPGRLIPELEALIAGHPYRERLHGLLMTALYRGGRQADALEAYRRARALLVEELGIEPGPELTRLEAAILAQDPALELPISSAAPTRSARPGRRVPSPASSILGREDELGQALRLIEDEEVRLVTLTGAGGIGKTRLAQELALRSDGRAWLVELAAITSPERILPAIAIGLGASDTSLEAVGALLEGEAAVLFLDNFEQVLGGAPVITGLLAAAPSLTVVVTSRAPLRVAGEHELSLPPLAQEAALQLFVSRASEHSASFSPGAAELAQIGAVCERLDGLPLAIELAAARARVLAPSEILDRIGDRLALLTAGRRDAPERHQTLRATIAWSHDLLEESEQQLLAELSVFRSGWTLEAAEAVADGPVLDGLASLVDHSLVARDGPRFRMLDTVREYATERLASRPDAGAVARRHALWCLSLAEAAEDPLEGPDQARWFGRLDVEQENLRAAGAWAAAHDEPEIALGLVGTLWRFWLARAAGPELRGVLPAALATNRGDPQLRAKALNAAGVLAAEAGDLDDARSRFAEALELAGQASDRGLIARILANLGVVAVFEADYPAALSRYQAAGDIWQELGNLRGHSIMLQNLGIVRDLMGQRGLALPLLEQSVELARASGDRMHLASTLIELGRALVHSDPVETRTPSLLREGLELAVELGDRPQVMQCFEVMAAFCAGTAAEAAGAELLGAADAERVRAGVERKPDELPFVDSTIEQLREALGPEAYEHAHNRGTERTHEDAVTLALQAADCAVGSAA